MYYKYLLQAVVHEKVIFQAKVLEKFVGKYINAAEIVLPWTEKLPGKGSNTIELSMDVNPRTKAVDTFIASPGSSLKIYKYPMSKLPFSTLIEWATQIGPSTGNSWLRMSIHKFFCTYCVIEFVLY